MAARAREAVGEKLREIWLTFLLRGILAAGLGLIALFWPTASIGLLLRVVGFFLLVDGVTAVVVLLRGGDRGSGLMHTIISLGTGAALLFLPGTSARAAFTLLGVWALVTGLGARARRSALAGRRMQFQTMPTALVPHICDDADLPERGSALFSGTTGQNRV